jgi:hypothetical protein
MKLPTRKPLSRLGLISLLLLILSFGAWLFVNNAQHCLDRDFIEQAPAAICWRQVNDYESTIDYGRSVFLCLLVLGIICCSATITRLIIKHSSPTLHEIRKTTWFLAALSTLLLTFIVTVIEISRRTTYNNNNYFLNSVTNVIIIIGIPLLLALVTTTATYGLSSWKKPT